MQYMVTGPSGAHPQLQSTVNEALDCLDSNPEYSGIAESTNGRTWHLWSMERLAAERRCRAVLISMQT